MSLEDIQKAEQSAEVVKVELEAQLEQSVKRNREYEVNNEELRERLAQSERQVAQLSISEARIKETHKAEIDRLLRRANRNHHKSSPGETNSDDDVNDSSASLRLTIDRLEAELRLKSEALEQMLSESDAKSQHVKAQLADLTGKNSELAKREIRLQSEVSRLSETLDLMTAETSTMREKMVVLQKERDRALHGLEEKSNEFLKLESKADTERAKLKEEIEKVFEEAEEAMEEKKQIQEEMETLITSNNYYEKELDEKNGQLAEKQAKIHSLEQLLLQFEDVGNSKNSGAGDAIRDLNQRLESRMAENNRLESELTMARQQSLIKENERCQLLQAMHDLKADAQKLSQNLAEKSSLIKTKDQELEDLLGELKAKDEEYAKLNESLLEQTKLNEQASSLDTRKFGENAQHLEGLLKDKVAQVHKANERYNDVSMKYIAIQEDFKSSKERHARETRDMQCRINSLKQYNEKLLQLKAVQESELEDLKKTSEHKIAQLEEHTEELQLLNDAQDQHLKLDGGSKAEFAEVLNNLRKKLQQRKDERGDPIALQQELNKVKRDYDRLLRTSKQQLASLKATLRDCKIQASKLQSDTISYSKHLGVNREALKGKEHQIEKLKADLSVAFTDKETVYQENRQLKLQIESILTQANRQRSEYAASGRQIQTLKQAVIERENRIADLLSNPANAKERMLLERERTVDDLEKRIKEFQVKVTEQSSVIDSLTARLTEDSRNMGRADVRHPIDVDLVFAWIADLQAALKPIVDLTGVTLTNHAQFAEVTAKLVDSIRALSVRSI